MNANAFIALGGFVSFASVNTARLAVDLALETTTAAAAAGLIATLVTGVFAGSLIGRLAGPRRRPAVFALVAALLAAAAGLSGTGASPAAAIVMALAMGAETAVFETDGEARIGLTYMTGTLVKLCPCMTAAMMGGDPLDWRPICCFHSGSPRAASPGR